MSVVLIAAAVAFGLAALLCTIGYIAKVTSGDWTDWPAPYAVAAVVFAFLAVFAWVAA